MKKMFKKIKRILGLELHLKGRGNMNYKYAYAIDRIIKEIERLRNYENTKDY